MAAVPVKDTIKVAGPDGVVLRTVDREGLWAAQTPQVFRTDLLVEAHRRITDDVTDDASMVERMGGEVKLFMGSYDNLKVTAPEDLRLAEALLGAREEARS
jgi:2-C-methyl-D-erythritol 4-phosphate cytidylyltransferase